MPVQVEILMGLERRRRWPEEEKRITEESFRPGAKVPDAARKHGVSRSLLFTRHREAGVDAVPVVPCLIPVQVTPA
jgi:transposase-like protein